MTATRYQGIMYDFAVLNAAQYQAAEAAVSRATVVLTKALHAS